MEHDDLQYVLNNGPFVYTKKRPTAEHSHYIELTSQNMGTYHIIERLEAPHKDGDAVVTQIENWVETVDDDGFTTGWVCAQVWGEWSNGLMRDLFGESG